MGDYVFRGDRLRSLFGRTMSTLYLYQSDGLVKEARDKQIQDNCCWNAYQLSQLLPFSPREKEGSEGSAPNKHALSR